jgi:hypothetical protein
LVTTLWLRLKDNQTKAGRTVSIAI